MDGDNRDGIWHVQDDEDGQEIRGKSPPVKVTGKQVKEILRHNVFISSHKVSKRYDI